MTDRLALTRLMQLISPSLPIGGYTYSQGIEWAVEAGWIGDQRELRDWLQGLIETAMQYLELPILLRMLDAWNREDTASVERWNEHLVASRETSELRLEEANRAQAFCRLLISLEPRASRYRPILLKSQSACYSYACSKWNIEYHEAASGMLWSWLENLVLSAVKLIPLGQTAGQQTIFELSALIPETVRQAATLADEDIGASSMALAIASSQHESQYTRLFRS